MSEHRTLIITGAGRGIGAATARAAGLAGYPVVVNYGGSEAAAHDVVAEILAKGGRAVAIQGDIGREADIIALFEKAEAAFGPIGSLVNNAGITGKLTRVEAVTADSIAQVLAVNVTGSIIAAREAVRRMSTKRGGAGGSIVNLSSLAVRTGGAGEWVHYAASKGAIDSFTIGLAREVAAEGIRVNAVAPGLIDTDIHASGGEPGRVARMGPGVPMGRGGAPEEVAGAILYLLSDAASYTTGTVIEVGGGR